MDSDALRTRINETLKNIGLIESYLFDNSPDWRNAIAGIFASIPVPEPDRTSPLEQKDLDELHSALNETDGAFLQIIDTTPQRLTNLKSRLQSIDEAIERGRAKGLTLDYVRMKARVIRSFIEYAHDDYSSDSFWHKIRAERVAAYLENLSDDALDEVQELLNNPANEKKVPRYHTDPVDIRNGAFWQNGRPVFFNGVGHFGQVREDIPIFEEYGLNIIQIEIGPSAVCQEDGTVNLEPLESSILNPLRQAEEHNVAVCVLLSPHYFPPWAFKKYPELSDGGFGFLKYDIDCPFAREVLERFLRAVVPKIAAYKSLHSFCLSNEPEYVSRSKHSAVLFHKWLKKTISIN